MVRGPALAAWSELAQALAAGTARTPPNPAGGARWLWAWALTCLAAGVLLYALGGHHTGFAALNAWASRHPDWLWQGLTVLGDERVPFALALFFARRQPRVFWALVLAAVVAAAYSRGLKALFDLPRPPAVLEPGRFHLNGPGPRRSSFPSGHSVTAAVFFGVLVYYARHMETRLLLVLLGTLAGLSRVAVGVHWPVDVAFGLFGGLAAAWIGARLAVRWPRPGADPSTHLALVALACFLTLTLTYWDNGYGLAAPLLAALGWAALAFAALDYGGRALWASAGARRGAQGPG